jgi:hypothetical protein
MPCLPLRVCNALSLVCRTYDHASSVDAASCMLVTPGACLTTPERNFLTGSFQREAQIGSQSRAASCTSSATWTRLFSSSFDSSRKTYAFTVATLMNSSRLISWFVSPAATRRIACTMSGGGVCLSRKPLAPARSARRT